MERKRRRKRELFNAHFKGTHSTYSALCIYTDIVSEASLHKRKKKLNDNSVEILLKMRTRKKRRRQGCVSVCL